MFATRDVLLTGVIAGLLAAAALVAWPWPRVHGRFAIAGVATFAGWCIWNFSLNAADAGGFNVDAPVVALSGQDAGSGVLTFALVVLALSLAEQEQPAGRVVLAALIAGVVATVFDIFVL